MFSAATSCRIRRASITTRSCKREAEIDFGRSALFEPSPAKSSPLCSSKVDIDLQRGSTNAQSPQARKKIYPSLLGHDSSPPSLLPHPPAGATGLSARQYLIPAAIGPRLLFTSPERATFTSVVAWEQVRSPHKFRRFVIVILHAFRRSLYIHFALQIAAASSHTLKPSRGTRVYLHQFQLASGSGASECRSTLRRDRVK